MIIKFDDFFERIKKATPIETQMELAEALDINRSAVTQAKNRDAVPQRWVLRLARHFSLSPDWLEFGTGVPRPAVEQAEPEDNLSFAGEVIMVPKVMATVSAGGGSYEVGAIPVSTHPFPRQWLSRMGNPNDMAFLNVVGRSMEPNIFDGDMVLIDQSSREIMANKIFAVGVEDSLYIKRIEQKKGELILHSDNPEFSDIKIYGEELNSFRILGKVVWLCRDCRF